MKEFKFLFLIYKPQGIIKALWTILRVFILPYEKLNKLIPSDARILDIGCGNGGLSNYLAIKSEDRNITGIDFSKKRISDAIKTIGSRKNIKFLQGNAVTTKLPKVDCYIIVDVLHHINTKNQDKLIRFFANRLDKNSLLIIKEVDPSDKVPFFFGHVIEKILYPDEKIYARSKKEWEQLFRSLGLSYRVLSGVFHFPDSTKIYVIHRTNSVNKKSKI